MSYSVRHFNERFLWTGIANIWPQTISSCQNKLSEVVFFRDGRRSKNIPLCCLRLFLRSDLSFSHKLAEAEIKNKFGFDCSTGGTDLKTCYGDFTLPPLPSPPFAMDHEF